MNDKIDWDSSSISLMDIYNLIPEDQDVRPPRIITQESIDTNAPWSYFDGSAQVEGCGGEAVIHMDNIMLIESRSD